MLKISEIEIQDVNKWSNSAKMEDYIEKNYFPRVRKLLRNTSLLTNGS